MTIYYSPEKDGFFDTDFTNYPDLPKDSIEITKEERDFFIHEMNVSRKKLVFENDSLTLIDRPVIITWEMIRDKRNGLLDKSDYTQVPDFPGDKAAWASYRQELRDIPQTFDKPEQVVWPWPPK